MVRSSGTDLMAGEARELDRQFASCHLLYLAVRVRWMWVEIVVQIA